MQAVPLPGCISSAGSFSSGRSNTNTTDLEALSRCSEDKECDTHASNQNKEPEDSGAGVFGSHNGNPEGEDEVSARSTDTHASPRARQANPSNGNSGNGQHTGHDNSSNNVYIATAGDGGKAGMTGDALGARTTRIDGGNGTATATSDLPAARQWVQLRKPWRVEARLLDMEEGVSCRLHVFLPFCR